MMHKVIELTGPEENLWGHSQRQSKFGKDHTDGIIMPGPEWLCYPERFNCPWGENDYTCCFFESLRNYVNQMPTSSLFFEGHFATLSFLYFKFNQRKIQNLQWEKTIAILRQIPLKFPLFIRIKAKLLNMVCMTVYSVLNATLFNLFLLSLTLPSSPLAIEPHSLVTTRPKYSHCCTPTASCLVTSYVSSDLSFPWPGMSPHLPTAHISWQN